MVKERAPARRHGTRQQPFRGARPARTCPPAGYSSDVKRAWRNIAVSLTAAAAMSLGAAAGVGRAKVAIHEPVAPATATVPLDPAAAAQAELRAMAATLGDASAPPAQREEAARRVLARHMPESQRVLLDTLA